jgi:hypothetical protein
MAELKDLAVMYDAAYLEGKRPTKAGVKPADVFYDKSSQTLWTFNGRTWVPTTYNSTFTLRLGRGATLKDRINSKYTYIPEKIEAYTGTDENVPDVLKYSEDDIVIKLPVQHVLIKVFCYVKDPITSLVSMVDVNPRTNFLSKGWLRVKDLIEAVGYNEMIMVIETSGGHDLINVLPPIDPDDPSNNLQFDMEYDVEYATDGDLTDDDQIWYDIIWSSDTGCDPDPTIYTGLGYEELERA